MIFSKDSLHSWSRVNQAVGTAGFSFSIWLLSTDFKSSGYQNWPAWIKTHAIGLQNLNILWYILLVFAFCYIVGFIGQGLRSARDRRLIQYIIDKAQSLAYPNTGDDPIHHHRITLFQHKKLAFVKHWSRGKRPKGVIKGFLWAINPWGKHKPYSGWLIPVCRSGSTVAKTKFLANPKTGENEGVVGKVFAAQRSLTFPKLPRVIKASSERQRRKYAESTNCNTGMINALLAKCVNDLPPQSIGGIPIRVGEKLWGVLVFDSQSPEGVEETIDQNFRLTTGAIEQLLGK